MALLVENETNGWELLNEEELLEKKISELHLDLGTNPLASRVQELYGELSAKNLSFHPPCHFGDEWFCPVGIPVIFVPFFLAHERLRKLERKMILEVEGETDAWFMQLLRHEAGHAYSYAYKLQRRGKWQKLFGLASQYAPDTYRPKPYSRSYVVHLADWYAQSHPDEDFAETFAVWLTPGSDWCERYRGWRAMAKLEYVDQLMKSIAGKPPIHQPPYDPQDYNCLQIKLRTYYQRKRKLYAESYSDFYDQDLRQLFPQTDGTATREKAARYLKQNRRKIMDAVSLWTNEKKYRVDQLLDRLIVRCQELGLEVVPAAPALNLHIASYVTSLIMNHLFTGKFKRTK